MARSLKKTLGPPPTTVGHSTQLSTTVSGTVAAWPAVTRWSVNAVCCVPGASVTVKSPGPLCPPASIWALVAAPKRSVWRPACAAASTLTVTCKRPGATLAVLTATRGRGLQVAATPWAGTGAPGVAVGVAVGSGVSSPVGVAVGVTVRVVVAVGAKNTVGPPPTVVGQSPPTLSTTSSAFGAGALLPSQPRGMCCQSATIPAGRGRHRAARTVIPPRAACRAAQPL
jgi:hypothetical protein